MLSFFPQSASFNKPLQKTISFSGVHAGDKLLIKETTPDGDIPIKSL